MNIRLGLIDVIWTCLLALSAVTAIAGPDTGATCDMPRNLSAPDPGLPPTIRVLHPEELKRNHWMPPACTGWHSDASARLVIEMVGSFRFKGTLEDLLARAGAVSNLRHVKYWSTTESTWRLLLTDASALKSPKRSDRRPDFSASEVRQGSPLYYWADDSRLGDIIYKMRVRASDSRHAIIMTENTTAIAPYFITLFEPGDLQSLDIESEVSPGTWRIYSLSRVERGSRLLAVVSDRSFINRALALFRYLSGASADQNEFAPP